MLAVTGLRKLRTITPGVERAKGRQKKFNVHECSPERERESVYACMRAYVSEVEGVYVCVCMRVYICACMLARARFFNHFT